VNPRVVIARIPPAISAIGTTASAAQGEAENRTARWSRRQARTCSRLNGSVRGVRFQLVVAVITPLNRMPPDRLIAQWRVDDSGSSGR
jgi:hypothetical protein